MEWSGIGIDKMEFTPCSLLHYSRLSYSRARISWKFTRISVDYRNQFCKNQDNQHVFMLDSCFKNPVIISRSIIMTIFCDAYLIEHVINKVIIMNSHMCVSVLCSLCWIFSELCTNHATKIVRINSRICIEILALCSEAILCVCVCIYFCNVLIMFIFPIIFF